MVNFLQDPNAKPRIVKVTLLVAILPLLIAVNFESTFNNNGVITYSYFGLSGIVGGLVGLVWVGRIFYQARYDQQLDWVVWIGLALLVLVSIIQIVRGSGIAVDYLDCEAAYSANFCRPISEK